MVTIAIRRRLIGFVAAASLAVPVGMILEAPLAFAAEQAAVGNVTVALGSEPGSGGNLSALGPGDYFSYLVDLTCQIPSCGDATLELSLPHGVSPVNVTAPPGAALVSKSDDLVVLSASPLTGDGLSWTVLAQVDEDAAITLNGPASASVLFTTTSGGVGGVATELSVSDTVTLKIP